MKLEYEVFRLQTRHPFTIARDPEDDADGHRIARYGLPRGPRDPDVEPDIPRVRIAPGVQPGAGVKRP